MTASKTLANVKWGRICIQLSLLLLPMLARADGGFDAQVFGSTTFWTSLLSALGIGLLGLAAFYLLAVLFAFLHLVLLLLLLIGRLRKQYWRKGIVACVVTLSVMYLCLAALLPQWHV